MVMSVGAAAALARRDPDSRAVLRSALAVLLPRQRAAVVLHYVADLDDAAVAAALGCSVSTVRSQISRALARLRQEPVPVMQGEQP